jgi:hypothetical protein
MNAAEVVICEMQGDSSFQVRQLLAERVCEPRKSPHRHSHCEVLPLHERRADMVGIGIALSDLGYNPRDAWWGVPRFGAVELPVVAKYFRELGEVHVCSEALRDGHGVMVQSVRRELHAVGKALIQVPQESPRIGAYALADAKRRHQLGFRVNRNVNPLVAKLGRVRAPHVAPLFPDVAPNLINLQIPGAEVSHSRVHQSGAALASDNEQTHDCVPIQAREPLCGSDRAALKKAMQRTLCCLGIRQEQIAGQFRVRFAESGIAGLTAPTLNPALTEVSEFLAGLVLAFGAGHGLFSACVEREKPYNEIGSGVRLTPRSGLAPQPVSAGYGAVSCYLATHGGLYTAGLLSGNRAEEFLLGDAPTNLGPFADLSAKSIFFAFVALAFIYGVIVGIVGGLEWVKSRPFVSMYGCEFLSLDFLAAFGSSQLGHFCVRFPAIRHSNPCLGKIGFDFSGVHAFKGGRNRCERIRCVLGKIKARSFQRIAHLRHCEPLFRVYFQNLPNILSQPSLLDVRVSNQLRPVKPLQKPLTISIGEQVDRRSNKLTQLADLNLDFSMLIAQSSQAPYGVSNNRFVIMGGHL